MDMKAYKVKLFAVGEVMTTYYFSTKAKVRKYLKSIEKENNIKLIEQEDYEISKLDIM
jgi:hypothetical protein